MGDDQHQKLCLHGLQSAAGFLQKKVAARIDTRYTPRLLFVLDMGVKRSIEIARLLDDVLPADDAADEVDVAAPSDDSSAEFDPADADADAGR